MTDTTCLSLYRLGSTLAEPKGTSDTNKKHPTTAHPPVIRWDDDISYYSPEPVRCASGSLSGMRDPPKCKAYGRRPPQASASFFFFLHIRHMRSDELGFGDQKVRGRFAIPTGCGPLPPARRPGVMLGIDESVDLLCPAGTQRLCNGLNTSRVFYGGVARILIFSVQPLHSSMPHCENVLSRPLSTVIRAIDHKCVP